MPAPLLGLGGFGPGGSEHPGWVTHGRGTGTKLPAPRELTCGNEGGRDMIVDCWMVDGFIERWMGSELGGKLSSGAGIIFF